MLLHNQKPPSKPASLSTVCASSSLAAVTLPHSKLTAYYPLTADHHHGMDQPHDKTHVDKTHVAQNAPASQSTDGDEAEFVYYVGRPS
jgi:hypothetical protein